MRPRTALVTGANRGIGLEVCRQLARKGYGVLLGSRILSKGDAAALAMRAEGLDVTAIEIDVTRPGQINAARHTIEHRFGGLDVLVNNAAVLVSESIGILEVSLDELQTTFATNVFAQIALCQAFVPRMVKRRFGRVVNVSSQAGQLKTMGTYAPAYSMSKTTLNAMTKIMAETTLGTGVLVNCVNPGWVRTDMGGLHAPRSPQQGAETIVWAATLPDNGPTGQFFTDMRTMEW